MSVNIDKFVKQLKTHNVRMTSQRYAILHFLALEGNHPTANDVYDYLKDDFPNMSVATVYNNLNFFKQAGIVTELPFSDGSNRFDLTEKRHYHAICTNCGKVEDFDYPSFEDAKRVAEETTQFKVEDHNFKVTGLCADCQKLKIHEGEEA